MQSRLKQDPMTSARPCAPDAIQYVKCVNVHEEADYVATEIKHLASKGP